MAGHDHTPDVHEHTDQWHHHSSAEGVPQVEHASVANPHVLIHWLILISIAMIVVIAALGMYFGKYYDQVRREKVETLYFYDNFGNPPREKAEGDLGVGKPVSQFVYHAASATTVQLPIEQAMNKVIAKYGSSKTAQATQK
jgi:hypothetical protein